MARLVQICTHEISAGICLIIQAKVFSADKSFAKRN